MSAISEYFTQNGNTKFIQYAQHRVQLDKIQKPAMSKKEKEEIIFNINSLLSRDNKIINNNYSQLISKIQQNIEEQYSVAIATDSGKTRVIFQPLDPILSSLNEAYKNINRLIKNYNSYSGQGLIKAIAKKHSLSIAQVEQKLNDIAQDLENLTEATLKLPNGIIKKYNDFISLAGELTPIHALAQGDFFEAVVAAANELKKEVAEDFAVDAVITQMQESIVGKNIEFTTIKKGAKNQSKQISKNGSHAKMIASQGKIDVFLTSSKRSKNKKIGASIKSYSSFANIHLESGTSMSKMLAGETNAYSEALLRILGEFKIPSEALKNKEGAQYSFELLAAYKALTGDLPGRKKADIFILNNTKTKKTYIVEMSEILYNIYQDHAKKQSFLITPEQYYMPLKAATSIDNLFTQASLSKLNIIFKTSARVLKKLENTVSG